MTSTQASSVPDDNAPTAAGSSRALRARRALSARASVAHPRRLRRAARRLLAALVGRWGYALVRVDATSSSPSESPDVELIPRHREQPFTTRDYLVLPAGRFDAVRHDYYSPIPDLERLPADIWTRRSALGGVELNAASGIDLVESRLSKFIAELDIAEHDPGRPGTFFLRNTGFESVDAELLYGMVRALRPRRVVELGSGYTTLLIGEAARRNAQEGCPTEHVAYDPFPRAAVLGGPTPPAPTRLEVISATDVPMETFDDLRADDVLFVDTTHTVKLGSDVNFLILDVLPRLHPGVVVHFHDIFLPWEYPRVWFEEMQYYWAEQYLLQAFLAFNAEFDVLIPAGAVAREYPDRLQQVIPSFRKGVSPGSMWLRRRLAAPDAGDRHESGGT